jgi:osmotically-inducible protein OsmY
MRSRTSSCAAGFLLVAGILSGCSHDTTKSLDVESEIRRSLDQAGFKDVSVSQDRDKGVVTLGGHVASDPDKQQAESIPKSLSVGQVVADQIAVEPPGAEGDAKDVNSDLDKGIKSNMDAALIQNRLKHGVSFSVRNGVVTLSGNVNSQIRRNQVEKIASGVPNVQQVVNEVQVKNQKASSTN